MSSHKTVELVSAAAEAIHAVFPRHPVKRLARLLGLPLGTAHEWCYRHLSSARRRELARALLREMDEQDVARTALRRQLATWAAEIGGDSDAALVSAGAG